MADFSNKRNIVLLVIWILSLVAAAILLSINVLVYVDTHYICGTIYGFVIVNSIIFASICAGEEIPPKTLCVALAFGAIFYFSSTALVALLFLDMMDNRQRDSLKVLIVLFELILCAVLCAMYIFTAVAIYGTKKL